MTEEEENFRSLTLIEQAIEIYTNMQNKWFCSCFHNKHITKQKSIPWYWKAVFGSTTVKVLGELRPFPCCSSPTVNEMCLHAGKNSHVMAKRRAHWEKAALSGRTTANLQPSVVSLMPPLWSQMLYNLQFYTYARTEEWMIYFPTLFLYGGCCFGGLWPIKKTHPRVCTSLHSHHCCGRVYGTHSPTANTKLF